VLITMRATRRCRPYSATTDTTVRSVKFSHFLAVGVVEIVAVVADVYICSRGIPPHTPRFVYTRWRTTPYTEVGLGVKRGVYLFIIIYIVIYIL
jgi:hypothetical protein